MRVRRKIRREEDVSKREHLPQHYHQHLNPVNPGPQINTDENGSQNQFSIRVIRGSGFTTDRFPCQTPQAFLRQVRVIKNQSGGDILLQGIFRTKNLDEILASVGGPQFSLKRSLTAFSVT